MTGTPSASERPIRAATCGKRKENAVLAAPAMTFDAAAAEHVLVRLHAVP
jgi:hypothetical protein